jgi:hypothetical protein
MPKVHSSDHETTSEPHQTPQEPTMTKTTQQAAALALSAILTLGVFAGANGLATQQYAKADALAMAPYGQAHVAVQHVVVVGRRAA